MKNIVLGTVKGRHELPANDFIFSNSIENPMDFQGIQKVANDKLTALLDIQVKHGEALNGSYNGFCEVFTATNSLTLYVTGLTVVTTAVIKFCALNGVKLTLMHYDAIAGDYKPQVIF